MPDKIALTPWLELMKAEGEARAATYCRICGHDIAKAATRGAVHPLLLGVDRNDYAAITQAFADAFRAGWDAHCGQQTPGGDSTDVETAFTEWAEGKRP